MSGTIIKPFETIQINTHYATSDGFPDRRRIAAVSMSERDWLVVVNAVEKSESKLNTLQARIAELEEAARWRTVEERPSYATPCGTDFFVRAVSREFPNIEHFRCSRYATAWDKWEGIEPSLIVTHWRHIDPPKEKD